MNFCISDLGIEQVAKYLGSKCFVKSRIFHSVLTQKVVTISGNGLNNHTTQTWRPFICTAWTFLALRKITWFQSIPKAGHRGDRRGY